jgi:hypothetical protein
MRDKDSISLESLYNQVIEEGAKKKSKKQIGFLLSDKVSPLSKKQKEKLKKELHTGKVKVKKKNLKESRNRGIGRSGESKLELDWTDDKNPDINGYWKAYYEYDASGYTSSGDWDNPPSSELNIRIDYLRIEESHEVGPDTVVYDNQDMKELKVSNPKLYTLVDEVREVIKEHELENEDNHEYDTRGEPEYDKYAGEDY